MKNTLMLLGIYVGLLITACSPSQENKLSQEKFPLTSPLLIDTLYTTEYIADIHSLQNVELRARIKGYLEKIYVDEGKPVKAGQLLFSISSQEYAQDLLKAQVMLKSAIAEAKSAELDLQNVKLLVEKNVVSKTEMEMAQSKLDAFNAKIEEAKSNEASARLNLSYTEVRAPFEGIINRIPNKIGSLIDEGTLLTTISNNQEVFAYFNVSEKEYLDFTTIINNTEKKNDLILVLANNQVHNHQGNIETVEGEFDKNTGNIAFRARFANPEKILKHGSSGKVRIKRELKNALIIPQKATFEIQDKLYVFVVDANNIVKTRNIVIKLRLPHLYVIESGLNPKDKIIYEGIQNVRDGMKINPEFIPLKRIIAQLVK